MLYRGVVVVPSTSGKQKAKQKEKKKKGWRKAQRAVNRKKGIQEVKN